MSHRYPPPSPSRAPNLMQNNNPSNNNIAHYPQGPSPPRIPPESNPHSHILANLFAPPPPLPPPPFFPNAIQPSNSSGNPFHPFHPLSNPSNSNTITGTHTHTQIPLNNLASLPDSSNTTINSHIPPWQYNNSPNTMNRNYSSSAPNPYSNVQPAFHVGSSAHIGNRASRANGSNPHHHTSSTRSAINHHLPQHQPNATSNAPLKLGDITPIREALETFSDESLMIIRFSQFLAHSNRALPPHERRSSITNFAGFDRRTKLKTEVLNQLIKSDLDTLLWALGLPRGGRKNDISNRIADAMKAPLKWRVPVRSQGPSYSHSRHAPHVSQRASNAIPPNSIPHMPNSNAGYHASAYNGYNPMQASNMPNMPGYASAAYPTQQRRSNQSKKKRSADVHIIVGQSDLMFSETPFNIPIAAPLGQPHYQHFSASQLSNGVLEPSLEFFSPDFDGLAQGDAKDKGDIQVHIRCLKVELTKPINEWKQSWPFPAAARVNEHFVELDQAQRFTNGKLAGVDKATDITKYLRGRRDRHLKNFIKLRRSANSVATASGNFILYVQPVLVRSMEAMQDIVRTNSAAYWAGYRATTVRQGMDPNATDYELGKREVVDWMSGGDGIAVASQKVSLKCPLSLMNIGIPVRGRDCTHIQCFDLENYLHYTRRSTKFKCPVCNKTDASPESLVISWFVAGAMEKYKKHCDEIEVMNDGSIKAVENIKTGVASDDEENNNNTYLYEEDTNPATKRRKLNGTPGNTNQRATAEVVDLTLDSDDDIPPPLEHMSPPPVQSNSNTQPQSNGAVDAAIAQNSTSMSQVTPEVASPATPAQIGEEEEENNNTNNQDEEIEEEEEEEELTGFNMSFTAAQNEVYPWDMNSDADVHDVGSNNNNNQEEENNNTEEENNNTKKDEQEEEQQRNNNNNNSGGGGHKIEWNNGAEVICLDD